MNGRSRIHRLALPTPFPVGDVNAYLIEDDPLTLVDCGPNTPQALERLTTGLAARGHALTDLDLVILTHHHPDHFGLAAELAARSGAQLACLDVWVPVIEGWERWVARADEEVRDGIQRHGVPTARAAALHAHHEGSGGAWATAAQIDRVLHDGETIVLRDRELQVLHRPGHSASDTVLHDAADDLLIAGDHLLSEISSNALVAPALGEWDGHRPRSLVDYRESLRRTAELDLDVVYGGHGPPVVDHRALISKRLASQERRADRIADVLARGPLHAHAIAGRLWGAELAEEQAYATLSEVLGHLDLLIAAGRVTEDRGDQVVTFAAA